MSQATVKTTISAAVENNNAECVDSEVVLFKFEERGSTTIETLSIGGKNEQYTASEYEPLSAEILSITSTANYTTYAPSEAYGCGSMVRDSITSCKEEDIDDIDMDYEYHLDKPRLDLPATELVIQNLSIMKERMNAISENKGRTLSANRTTSNWMHTEAVTGKHKISAALNTSDNVYGLSAQVDLNLNNCSFEQCLVFDEKNVNKEQLTAREQEAEDEPVRRAMQYFFDNMFVKAISILQTQACRDPLYAVTIAFILFMRATLTRNVDDFRLSLKSLDVTMAIANTQIRSTSSRNSRQNTWLPFIRPTFSQNEQSSLPPTLRLHKASDTVQKSRFTPNYTLRAFAIRAECALMSAILQMTQNGSFIGNECTMQLKRAYNDYAFVWQEYKSMGQEFTKHIDRETLSAVHLGIGSLHLILSCYPQKKVKALLTAMKFRCDKQLGMALLKLCIESGGIRSFAAHTIILGYCTYVSAQAPRLYAADLMKTAVDCLTRAQTLYSSSCFLQLQIMRVSRILRNIRLSSQSADLAINQTHNEWISAAVSGIGRLELARNLVLQLNWEAAAACYKNLRENKDFHCYSYTIVHYFEGACYGMMGEHSKSILSFADVHRRLERVRSNPSKPSIPVYSLGEFIGQRINFFQKNGYQDLEFCLPALELLLVTNGFDQMNHAERSICLSHTERILTNIYEREKLDYTIRRHQLMPSTILPNYYEHRAIAMLLKACILNAEGKFDQSIASINWIMDNKQYLQTESWILPLTYWEAGFTSWGLGSLPKCRHLWETALAFKKYPLETVLTVRLNLALNLCDEKGITSVVAAQKRPRAVLDVTRDLPISNITDTLQEQ